MERPYAIPGGVWAAWAVSAVPAAFACLAIAIAAAAAWTDLAVAAAVVAIVYAAGAWRERREAVGRGEGLKSEDGEAEAGEGLVVGLLGGSVDSEASEPCSPRVVPAR
jgi:hypothetical protein